MAYKPRSVSRRWVPFLVAVLVVTTAIGGQPTAGSQPWTDKQISDWSEDDANQVLIDSPWVKTVKPTDTSSEKKAQKAEGSEHPGGILGTLGIGLPGVGRRNARREETDETASPEYSGTSTLKLRWESALPVRAAELKTRDMSAPDVDEDHYAIAVYGVSSRVTKGNQQHLTDQLKNEAVIKRDGKKDLKPSSVEVFRPDDAPVILYLFPRSEEITEQDKQIEFDAHIGPLQFAQSFDVEDMQYQGKPEL